VEEASLPRNLLEAVVRTAAGVFDAAATSLALAEPDGELVHQAAWGAGASSVLGMRLPRGRGVAGAVLARCEGSAVPDCRADARFEAQVAERTGYVPYTMLVVPLRRAGRAIGVLSLLDRRDGLPYTAEDIRRADLFAELAVGVLDSDPSLGAGATDPAS
jgi:GAF domain-containing protein